MKSYKGWRIGPLEAMWNFAGFESALFSKRKKIRELYDIDENLRQNFGLLRLAAGMEEVL